MRKIEIKIDRNGRADCSAQRLGYGGEHNATVLSFVFDTEAGKLYGECDFFRVVIDGNISDPLYPENGVISFSVPEACVKPPEVQCQLVGYKQTSGTVEAILKTAVFTLETEFSETVNDSIENVPGVFERILAACTDKAFSAAESAEKAESERIKAVAAAEKAAESAVSGAESASAALGFSLDSLKAAERSEKSSEQAEAALRSLGDISNSLKGSVSGNGIVAARGVSPTEHVMNVKVRSKNLLPFPYYRSSVTDHGVTFTVSDDGTITASGTATGGNGVFHLFHSSETPNIFELLPYQNYTVSGIPTGASSATWWFRIITQNTDTLDFNDRNLTQQLNFSRVDYARDVFLSVREGVSADGLVFKPQVEKGSSATSFATFRDISKSQSESKTFDFGETAREVMFSGSADKASITSSTVHPYCVAALAPVIVYKSGSSEQTEVLSGSAVPITSSMYGELPFNFELNYSVSGSTVTWSGFKQALLSSTGQLYEKTDIGGSYDTGHADVKIKGFRQIYGLDSGNPLYQTPGFDTVDFSVSLRSEGEGGVSVERHGKNLFPKITEWKWYGPTDTGINIALENGGLKISGSTSTLVMLAINNNNEFPNLPNGTYRASVTSKVAYPYIHMTDGTYAQWDKPFTITDDNKVVQVHIRIRPNSRISDLCFFQVEPGSDVTEYEEYKEPERLAVGADGSVENAASLYPTTVLTSDTDGVVIDCEYNRDINKAFEELQQAIIGLGGNV